MSVILHLQDIVDKDLNYKTAGRNISMPIKVLLVDDHKIMRSGLKRLLRDDDEIEIIGQADSGIEALDLVRQLSPDVVIMDIRMPNPNGIEAASQVKRDYPETKIIGLSMHSSKKFVTGMLKAGADGYLLKDCGPDELKKAIHAVMQGHTYLSPSITDTVVDDFVKEPQERNDPENVFSVLTHREIEVLQLLAEGNTTKQIGLKLHISPKTVEAHRLRVMKKLEIDNIANLTKYAIQEGLTSSEPQAE